MSKFLIRNDDVAFDTNLGRLAEFCGICDRHGYKIIQAITPIGLGGKYARAHLTNDQIRLGSFRRFEENKDLVDFLRSRQDLIGVHGLWHTHSPTEEEIGKASTILTSLGFAPSYYVPPFNEGQYPPVVEGLITSQLSIEAGQNLETFLTEGTPESAIMYLHSWRFNRNYSFVDLDACLARLAPKISKLTDYPADPIRLWYNEWVEANALGKVLDIGKSRHWDYGFPTLDTNPKLNPTYLGNIEEMDLSDESFDTVLCNGMYEFVENPQNMINEAIRVTKKGGTTIFGVVGPDYKPYKKDWKFFEGKETLPPHTRIDFGNEYYFLICIKPFST